MNESLLIPGLVLAADGNPLSSVTVTLVDGPEPYDGPSVITDAEGRFALTAPSAGRWIVGLEDGGSSETATVDVPTQEPVAIRVR